MQLHQIVLLLIPLVYSKEHIIHWNTTNTLFRGFDDPEINVRIGDTIKVFCPDETADDRAKHLIVNQVSEMSYLSCTLETLRTQVLLCNKKMRRTTLINIKRTALLPGSPKFEPGSTYYWISTSGGQEENIDRGTRGLCNSDNLRLRINVEEMKTTTAAPATDARLHPKARVMAGKIPNSLDRNYVLEVAKLANEGRTGIFPRDENDRIKNTRLSSDDLLLRNPIMDSKSKNNGEYPWQPVPVESYTELLNDAHLIYGSLNQPEDIEFVVHESHDESESLHARSYPLESSACMSSFSIFLIFLISLYL
ncbi:unnamed protein product [Auanema sp. JU1783]|nr:unnamed protein product [Auanema sp. JU1783]